MKLLRSAQVLHNTFWKRPGACRSGAGDGIAISCSEEVYEGAKRKTIFFLYNSSYYFLGCRLFVL
jgi:hypothetical protein